MAALVWLLIPVMAVCIAGLWSSWATRKRTNGGGDAAGVAGYDAFRSAMERAGQPKASDESRITDNEPSHPSHNAGSATGSDPSTPSTPRTSGILSTTDAPADPLLSGDPTPERVPTGVTTDSPSRAAD